MDHVNVFLWKSILYLPCFAGETGVEVCSHGNGPHLPLDVHLGVHSGNCWPLPPSLACWNDLVHNTEEEARI